VFSSRKNHVSETHATLQYDLARLKRGLKPFKLHWFPTLGSTNSHAAKMRREGRLLAPSVVLTGNQTAGRGRGSNVWHSTRGIITATFILPAHDSLPPQHVPLVAGLAVRDAVASFGVEEVKIKWPNDLWIEDRKVAGLLCERIDKIDLIGVGLNVNTSSATLPGKLRTVATSMAAYSREPLVITEVLVRLAQALRSHLADSRTSLALLLPQIRAHDALLGRNIRIQDADGVIEGRSRGIDAAGRLRVWNGSHELALFTGSVSLATRDSS
jgi:BirA family biotin operon repressor/biotin-[acetyl-CoA-carboxylase] ligase